MSEMKVNVRYFASIRDLIGINEEVISIPAGSTVEYLSGTVKEVYEQLKEVEKILIAVNGVYVSPETLLYDGDTVALFPPVSGG